MSRLSLLSGSAIAACVMVVGAPASAQAVRDFDIPAGTLSDALNTYATQADQQIFFSGDMVAGLRSEGLRGRYAPTAALDRLLAGKGLSWAKTRPGVIYLRKGAALASNGEPVTQVEDVVVTGTLLRNSGDLASPVVSLDRDAMDRRGFGTVAEALTDLPQNYAGSATPIVQLANADPGGSNNVYATGVNLRGLGPAATLVLVNGRRLAGTGLRGEFADISALPSAAVQRVDVLLDGASALYGADAVAGVVNVIMRPSFDGQESRIRAAAAEGGAEDLMISHLTGKAWSSGSAYLSYEYQTTNALSSYDRAYTSDGDLRPFGGTDHRNVYGAPGNLLAFNAVTSSYVSQYAIRPNASGTAQTAADFVAGEANRQSTSLGTDLLPAIERQSAYGRVRQTFGDRLEVSADARYNLRTYEVAGAAGIGILSVTRANPWFVSPTGAAAHTVGYSFINDLGATRQTGRSESFGLTAGARYDLSADWSAEAYLAWAEERGDLGVYNRVHSRFLNEALGTLADDPATPFRAAVDGYFNPFGNGTTNSRTVLDFIGAGYSEAHNVSGASSANLLVQGPVLRLPGGALALALGVQARRETFKTTGINFASTVTPQTILTPDRERSITAVFAEARVPVVGPESARPGIRSLELSFAGRWEEYDDFGTTTNPKIGIVWSPMKDLGLRASWGTSFRAGSLPQINEAPGASGLFLARPDGTQALTLSLIGGNPELKPETSETLTLGFDYRPTEGPRFSANYFDTRFKDRLGRPASENLLVALTDPSLSTFVTLVNPASNPADRALLESYSSLPGFPTLYPITTFAAIVDSRWVNTGKVEVRGVDLSGSWAAAIGRDRIALDASASYILAYETQSTLTAPVRDVSGLIGYPVKLRGRAGVTWSHGEFGVGLHWNHVDGYEDRLGTRIKAWETFDGQLTWSPDAGSALPIQVAITVQNLLNEDPPFYDAPTGYGFDAGQAGLLGRVVSLQLTRRW